MKLQPRTLACAWTLALACGLSQARAGTLDDFETLSGWQGFSTEGSTISLRRAPGRSGGALEYDFDLRGAYAYALVRKEFSIDAPENFVFSFDLKARAPVNNFEFKVFDENGNVFWIKQLDWTYPREWTRRRISKGQLNFAWGPKPGEPLKRVRKVEFVVSCGNGGTGKVFLDNFRFDSIEAGPAKSAVLAGGEAPSMDASGDSMSPWRSPGGREKERLTIDFGRKREIGGLAIDFDGGAYASDYDASLSDDGREWTPGYSVRNAKGGRNYLPLKEGFGRFLRLDFRTPGGKILAIKSLSVKGPAFSATANGLYKEIAADAPAGYYPKHLRNRQSFWTVIGASQGTKKALINEQGQIELGRLRFSIEPFLYADGKLVTWNDAKTVPSLLDSYLPIPSVVWTCGDSWKLSIQAFAAGSPEDSTLLVKYTVESLKGNAPARFFAAIRPFQVLPPWQALNTEGGASSIKSIREKRGFIEADEFRIVPMTPPAEFGAAAFDQGDITDYLSKGKVPGRRGVSDHAALASGALAWDLGSGAGAKTEIFLAVPLHRPKSFPSGAAAFYDKALSETAASWRDKLDRFRISLPPASGAVAATLKSQLAYILINTEGPRIQPGSRTYARSWIRDGALISSALMRMGNLSEARAFIDWYARGQFPSGKVPCVIDSHGPDAVAEHDSHGELIYAIWQHFGYSGDAAWLREKFPAVVKAARFMQSLRAERMTAEYRDGPPEKRALFGLVPESISHEGYWETPRHSYWDDFFVLRGFKDAAAVAEALGEASLAAEFKAEASAFRKDLYASMRQAMANAKIDYIPGCAELGDFDATSTTIGLDPGGELGEIPEPQLHNTFEKYWRNFLDREKNGSPNYTPYETRVIGSFVLLGQKDRAEEALRFFMNDRRPKEWNHWAEVVWPDPDTPKYIGDMPHTWVGSDFIRSILAMFWYERESDGAIVLASGFPDSWVSDPAGLKAEEMPTPYGKIGYRLLREGDRVTVRLSGTIDAGKRPLVVKSPLSAPLKGVRIDGTDAPAPESGEVRLRRLPSSGEPLSVEFLY
jgi:hypothetical protein